MNGRVERVEDQFVTLCYSFWEAVTFMNGLVERVEGQFVTMLQFFSGVGCIYSYILLNR